jgi:hypothetical protein
MINKGQSIVEYALIASLVIFGIVFMGGYVLRSINAHFKLWDEGVQDSFSEFINQSQNVPVLNVDCQCSQVNGTCGCNTAGCPCPSNEREIDTVCSPQACNGGPGSSCVMDLSCCGAPVPVGCGTVPTNFTPAPPAPPNTTNCYFGQQIYQAQCGNTITVTCVNDPNCPLPQCIGTILYPNSTQYCPGAQVGLARDMPNIYVGNSIASCGTNPPPCQLYCIPPYFLNTARTGCLQGFTVAAILPQINYVPQSCSASTNFPPGSCSPSCTIMSSSNCNNCSCSTQDDTQGNNVGICGCVKQCNHPGDCIVTTNKQSFTVCIPGVTVTGTSLQAIPPPVPPSPPIPIINGGCGDPGEPNQTCGILVTTG